MRVEGVSQAAGHARAMAAEMSGRAMGGRLRRVGVKGSRLVDQAVASTPARKGSLADQSMSGWGRGGRRRGDPLKIRGYARVNEGAVKVTITAGPTSGLMRVLESGRRAAGVGEANLRYVQTKTKGLRVRKRIVKRAQGATEGKRTWTRATADMGRVMGREMTREQALALRKAFGR